MNISNCSISKLGSAMIMIFHDLKSTRSIDSTPTNRFWIHFCIIVFASRPLWKLPAEKTSVRKLYWKKHVHEKKSLTKCPITWAIDLRIQMRAWYLHSWTSIIWDRRENEDFSIVFGWYHITYSVVRSEKCTPDYHISSPSARVSQASCDV